MCVCRNEKQLVKGTTCLSTIYIINEWIYKHSEGDLPTASPLGKLFPNHNTDFEKQWQPLGIYSNYKHLVLMM